MELAHRQTDRQTDRQTEGKGRFYSAMYCMYERSLYEERNAHVTVLYKKEPPMRESGMTNEARVCRVPVYMHIRGARFARNAVLYLPIPGIDVVTYSFLTLPFCQGLRRSIFLRFGPVKDVAR